jgi:hypothetical protein
MRVSLQPSLKKACYVVKRHNAAAAAQQPATSRDNLSKIMSAGLCAHSSLRLARGARPNYTLGECGVELILGCADQKGPLSVELKSLRKTTLIKYHLRTSIISYINLSQMPQREINSPRTWLDQLLKIFLRTSKLVLSEIQFQCPTFFIFIGT